MVDVYRREKDLIEERLDKMCAELTLEREFFAAVLLRTLMDSIERLDDAFPKTT